jgi:hypothetical protein
VGNFAYGFQKSQRIPPKLSIFNLGKQAFRAFLGTFPDPSFSLNADRSAPVKDPSALRPLYVHHPIPAAFVPDLCLLHSSLHDGRVRRTRPGRRRVPPAVPLTRSRLFRQSWSTSLVCRSSIYRSQFVSATQSYLRSTGENSRWLVV